MQEPQQHCFESQTLRTNPASAPARTRQDFPVQPYPHVTQNQCQGDEEKSYPGIARASLDASFVQLPITRLDAEPLSVGVGYPARRSRLDSPKCVDPRVTSLLLPRSAVVAAKHADRHGRFFLSRDQRVLTPAAAFPNLKRADSFGRLAV